jgi:hypothetical protein
VYARAIEERRCAGRCFEAPLFEGQSEAAPSRCQQLDCPCAVFADSPFIASAHEPRGKGFPIAFRPCYRRTPFLAP